MKNKDYENARYIRKVSNEWILEESLSSMFVRHGLPEEIDTRFIEPVLLSNGCGAYWRYNDKWVFTAADLAGAPDPYGLGKDVICRAEDGNTVYFEYWRDNPDVVVCFNNSTITPDLNIGKFAAMLESVETSLELNTVYSRLYPIPVVKDETQRLAMETIYNNMLTGKPQSIISNNLLNDLMISGTPRPAIEIANLSDSSSVTYIQYLAKYRDDILRWFWNIYGQNASATSKLAQQTTDEIKTGAGISMIIPHARYHERQREVAELARKFGWKVTVEFAEPWLYEFNRCEGEDPHDLDDTPDDITDETPDDVTDETPDDNTEEVTDNE